MREQRSRANCFHVSNPLCCYMFPSDKFWISRSLNHSWQVRLTVLMEAELPSLLPKGLIWVSVPGVMFTPTHWCSRWWFQTSHYIWGTSRRQSFCSLFTCRLGLDGAGWGCSRHGYFTALWQKRWMWQGSLLWLWQESLQLWQRSLQCPAAGMLAESAVKLSDTCSVIPMTHTFTQKEFF